MKPFAKLATLFLKKRFPRSEGPKKPKDRTSFNFLGFTHYWAISRKGNWVIKRKTDKSRFTRAVKRIAEWCGINRYRTLTEQRKILSSKLNGHYNYYGITANGMWIGRFYYQVMRTWRKWLDRRSRIRNLNRDKFNLLLKHYPLPTPRIVHSACS